MRTIFLILLGAVAHFAVAQTPPPAPAPATTFQAHNVPLRVNPSNTYELGGALRFCTSRIEDPGLVNSALRYRESTDPVTWILSSAGSLGCQVQSQVYGFPSRISVEPLPSAYPYTQVGDCSSWRNVLEVVVTCDRRNENFREFLKLAVGKPKQIRLRTSKTTTSNCGSELCFYAESESESE